MAKSKINDAEQIPAEEKSPRLAAEDADETSQSIQEAAYYIGLNRRSNSHSGDELNDWYQAEKAVKGNLD